MREDGSGVESISEREVGLGRTSVRVGRDISQMIETMQEAKEGSRMVI